jgi:hypothetical protein
MRKLFLSFVLILSFSAPSFAAFHLGITAGYSYSNLEGLDTYWQNIKADTTANTALASAPRWTSYGNGLFANIDLNFNIDKNLLVGLRSGVQYIFPSTYTGFREIPIDIPPVTMTWVNTETSIDNMLIPFMAGLSYYIPFGDSLMSMRLDAYAGWGLAYCGQRTKYEDVGPLLSLYSGNGFTADLSAAFEIKLLPFLSASINGGYRFAKTSGYKSIDSITADIPGYGTYKVPTNDPFNDESGKPVDVDFTGMNIGIGINIRI